MLLSLLNVSKVNEVDQPKKYLINKVDQPKKYLTQKVLFLRLRKYSPAFIKHNY